MGMLNPVNMRLYMANQACGKPTGMLEDFPVQIGKFFVPVDLIVADILYDESVPIILGRPFLATVGSNIDLREAYMTFNIGGELLKYRLKKTTKNVDEEECNAIQQYRFQDFDTPIHEFLEPFLQGDHLDSLLPNEDDGLTDFEHLVEEIERLEDFPLMAKAEIANSKEPPLHLHLSLSNFPTL